MARFELTTPALSIQRPLPKPSIVNRLPSWPNHRPTVAKKKDEEIIPKRQTRDGSVGVSPKPSIDGSAYRAIPKVCLGTLMRSSRVDKSYITQPSEKGLHAGSNGTLEWLGLIETKETNAHCSPFTRNTFQAVFTGL